MLPTLIQFQVLCLLPREGIGGPELREQLQKQRTIGTGRASFYEMMEKLRSAKWVTSTPEVVEVDGETYKQNRYKLSADGARAICAFSAEAARAQRGRRALGWARSMA